MVLAAASLDPGTLWTIIGVAATLVVAAVTLWLTYLWSVPKRRLHYWLASKTPLLLSAPSELSDQLEVHHDGRVVAEPHVLEVRVASRGRRDIPSSSFDGDQPIRVDVGASILEILGNDSDTKAVPKPVVRVDGTALEIGPALLKRRHTLTYRLLVDGPEPRLTCHASLVDVTVLSRPDEADAGRGRRLVAVAIVVAAGTIALIAANGGSPTSAAVKGVAEGVASGGAATLAVALTRIGIERVCRVWTARAFGGVKNETPDGSPPPRDCGRLNMGG